MSDLLAQPAELLKWMAAHIKIQDRLGKLVPFVPNYIQQIVFARMVAQHRAGYPVRLMVLKHRQPGISSFVDLLFYTLVFLEPNKKALVCAHTDGASTTLFDRIQLAHAYNPLAKKEDMEHVERRELIWKPPHNGRFEMETAGNKTLARSGTYQYGHKSEVAFWIHDADAAKAVNQTILRAHGTIVVDESTANGAAGVFYDDWTRATQHQCDYPDSLDETQPLFFCPLDDPMCRLPVPKTYNGGNLSAEEASILKEFGDRATREFFYWRRQILEKECNNDLNSLHSEYPMTPGEAFVQSGSPAIPGDILKTHNGQVRAPKYCLLEWVDGKKRVEPLWLETAGPGCWKVWAEPQDGFDYAMGADVALGERSDVNDWTSELDYSVIGVLERSELRTAAEYVGQPSPAELAEEMEKAHTWYNHAYLAPEINAHGYSTLERLLADGYAKWLGQREGHIDDMASVDPAKYGYLSTSDKMHRYKLVNDWIEACRGHGSPTVICHSKRLVDEEALFVRDTKGWMHHKPSKRAHDDTLFGWMIALHVHKTCPRQRTVIRAPMSPMQKAHTIGSYMIDGGRDDMIPELEEPETAELAETT